MANNKLSIVLMTHRVDATARLSIETAASMACEDVHVHIGDNSLDPEKWEFMHNVSQRSSYCHVYCHAENLASGGNWVFLMEKQQNEFICLLNDDDIFAPNYFASGLDILRSNPKCSAASGLFLSLAWRDNQPSFELAMPHEEEAVIDRIRGYANYTGFNSPTYAVHRRAHILKFVEYMRDRPFFPAYMDQFFTMTVLAQGTRIVDNTQQIYLYNNQNWVNRESIDKANSGYYIAIGLPEKFKHLHLLCWAADMAHYFRSTYRPENLSHTEVSEIIDVLHHRLIRQLFVPHLLANLAAVTELFCNKPEALKLLQAVVETPPSETAAFLRLFVAILEVFDASLAARYATFTSNSLLN